jgi:hypothetical protein
MAKALAGAVAIAFLIICILAPGARAQTASTGAISGTVTDSSGAAIANVTVTAMDTGTGRTRTVMTGADGVYNVTLLPLGTYTVKFAATGFNSSEVPSVTVNVSETAVLNQVLAVGTQTQQVTVTGEAVEAVQTANATLGDVVGGTAAVGLPLTTRNYTNLLGLSSGANAGVFNAVTLGKGQTDIAVNGANASQNNVQMDGVSITNNMAQGTLTENGLNPGIGYVNPDAIQEFKIQTSLFDAGYGRNVGGNVNVVTKSGTNLFHGSAFEFFRNTDLNANDFFRNQSLPVNGVPNNSRQVLNQNQFGAVVGGPIKKDKLFFFGSYQGTRQINGAAAQGYSAPSLLPIFPGGDRSNSAALAASLGATFCPGGTDGGSPGNGKPGAAVQVLCSGANINPVAIALLQLKNPDGTYYIPSSGPVTGNGTTTSVVPTTFSIPARFQEDQGLGNLDYVINGKNTLSIRYFYTKDPTQISFSCGSGGGAPGICYPDTALTNTVSNHYAVVKLTSILTDHLVNEARISLQRNTFIAQMDSQFTDTQVGMQPIVPQINNLNQITVQNIFTIGSAGNYPNAKRITEWEVGDELSWTHGKNTVRYGIEFERDRYNWILVGLANGSLTFQTFQDFLLGLPGCAPTAVGCNATTPGLTNGTTTSNISSSGTTTAATPPGGLIHGYRTPFGDAYVQDDIKLTPQFTLNLGLRWEYDALPYDSQGLSSNIWPSLINTVPIPGTTPATGTLAGFVIPSNWNPQLVVAPPVGGVFQNSHKGVEQVNTPLTNFAPRLGFAWAPLASNRLVVRGGAGYFYDRVGQGQYNVGPTQGEPYATSVFASAAANYYSTEAVPYQNTALQWTPRWVNINSATQTGTSSNLSNILVEPDYRTPVVYEWNLNVQYEVISHWTIELGYVGSRGLHQFGSRQINEAQLAGALSSTNTMVAPAIANGLITSNSTQNASLRVPYLGFAPLGLSMSQADTDVKYNSAQATLRKQFSHGFQAQAAYTFSRAYNTVFNINDPNIYVYGPNAQYHPQRLAISYLWNLPLGAHQGLVDKLTSGWGFSGVTVVQDGTPLTALDSRGGSIYGFGGASAVVSSAEYCAGMGAANAGSPGSIEQRLGGLNGGQGYFNKAAFVGTTGVGAVACATPGAALPSIGNGTGYGNSGLGILLGPGQFNWDMSLTKTTRVGGIREDATLQFRAEFFNAFNHPQFSNPVQVSGVTGGVDVNKATFGNITTTSVNPRLIQFGLKYAF